MGAVLCMSSVVSSVSSWAGSASSGGGTAVRELRSGRLVLLDLLEASPDLDPDAVDLQYAPDQLAATPLAMTIGYDRTQAKKLAAYPGAVKRLNAWQASSPIIVGLIRQALDGMDWVFTPFAQEVCRPEKIPARFGRDAAYSAVVYNERFGARMSLPVVNQLGHTSMIGLLVHEALRHAQIAYEDGMSEENPAQRDG